MSNLWEKILAEANELDNTIARLLIKKYIENSNNLLEAVFKILVTKLSDKDFEIGDLMLLFKEKIKNIDIEKDLKAFYDRDFACKTYIEVLLLYRGFHALVLYRLAHELWKNDEYFMANWLSKKTCELYSVDIHPAAKIGEGLVIDHAMGVVIGETCVIGDHVFLFHNVTLGGTGKSDGDRHPKIKSNVVIGTNATVLGNITIGEHSVVAAGSVVLNNVLPYTVVAGVPAVTKGKSKKIQ